MIRAHMVLLLSVLTGCTETITFRSPLENLAGLEITPGDALVTLNDIQLPEAQHHRLQYTAIGTFLDGSTSDVTQYVDWSIDNELLGRVEPGGLFIASHTAAGYATVTAGKRGFTATAKLTIHIDATLVDTTYPPPRAGLFDPANPVIGGEPTRSPTLIYPAEGTIMPQGVSRTVFQFLRGTGNDAFQLRFDSDVLQLRIELGGNAVDRWEADNGLQMVIAGSGIAAPIRVEVRATSSIGTGVVYAGNHIMLAFTRDRPLGPLYYRAATVTGPVPADGITRGGLDIPNASKMYPSGTTCVGCHAVTRDATAMAMGYDITSSIDLQAIDLVTLAPKIVANGTRPTGWATYSPDNTRVLVANDGVLKLYDASNGNSLGSVPLPSMRWATHPDWSPDGNYVAVALTSQQPTNRDVKAASIARIPYNSGTWGAPEILVNGSTTSNNYFPRYSPDGKRLLYVHAASTSQGATTAELMLMPAGGGNAVLLRIASHRVGTFNDMPDLSNTMPAWSQQVGERAWIAFVSARPYGNVKPTIGGGQIWIASLDPTQALDSAAFWLPCQNSNAFNYNPVWSANPIEP